MTGFTQWIEGSKGHSPRRGKKGLTADAERRINDLTGESGTRWKTFPWCFAKVALVPLTPIWGDSSSFFSTRTDTGMGVQHQLPISALGSLLLSSCLQYYVSSTKDRGGERSEMDVRGAGVTGGRGWRLRWSLERAVVNYGVLICRSSTI